MKTKFIICILLLYTGLLTGCGARNLSSAINGPWGVVPEATISERPRLELKSKLFSNEHYIDEEHLTELNGYRFIDHTAQTFTFKNFQFGVFFFYDYENNTGKHLIVSCNKKTNKYSYNITIHPVDTRKFKAYWDHDSESILVMGQAPSGVYSGWQLVNSKPYPATRLKDSSGFYRPSEPRRKQSPKKQKKRPSCSKSNPPKHHKPATLQPLNAPALPQITDENPLEFNIPRNCHPKKKPQIKLHES